MSAKPATPKQLSYLKRLAAERGQSFTYPHTAFEASREINRLKQVRPDSRADCYRERADFRRRPNSTLWSPST